MQKLKQTRQKHKNKQKETDNKTEKLEGKHKQNRNTGFPAHEPSRKINISKGLAGRFLIFHVFYVFVVFLRVVYVFYVFICVFVRL